MKNPDDVIRGAVMGRRDFLYMTAGTAAAAALSGCATNPVTGKSQLMFVSEAEERRIDLENAPHQFSEDYGAAQDAALNAYLTQVGQGLAVKTHRPAMPYTFRAVNAVHVNAYTFPAGSMTVTRGMLASMQSEAELAAVLGHELGHVNSRHTAQSMTKGIVAQALLAVAVTALEVTDNQDYAGLVAIGGMVGSGLYLARYSRKHEWQADGLGMKYMTDAGYP
ncbi:MAG: M48 family metalloprotease, partial [Lentisphaerae bacterium]|nr:M48 family metalloprotease [Lentisphaerota bacterium]